MQSRIVHILLPLKMSKSNRFLTINFVIELTPQTTDLDIVRDHTAAQFPVTSSIKVCAPLLLRRFIRMDRCISCTEPRILQLNSAPQQLAQLVL